MGFHAGITISGDHHRSCNQNHLGIARMLLSETRAIHCYADDKMTEKRTQLRARAVAVSSVVIIFSAFLAGCESRPQPGREVGVAGVWMSWRRSSPDEAWLYLNFYEYYEKYSSYGIALYHCDSVTGSDYSDEDFVADSLRMCRDSFMSGYRDGTLKHAKLIGNQGEYDRFEIQYIVVIMRDRNPAKDFQVGGIFTAGDVFRRDVDLKELVRDVGLQRGVLMKDDPLTSQEELQGYSIYEKARFQIIERHMKKTASGASTAPNS